MLNDVYFSTKKLRYLNLFLNFLQSDFIILRKSNQRRDAKVILSPISPLFFSTFPNGRVSAFLIYLIAVVLSLAINSELLLNVKS